MNKTWLTAFGMTILAFLLSLLLASPVSFSVMSLFSSPQKTDTQLSDFYVQLADRRPVRDLDRDVVVVDIEGAGRGELTELFEFLSVAEPRAVGLDVMFGDEREGDDALIAAISSIPNVVLPIGVDTDPEGISTPKDFSYFQNRLIEAPDPEKEETKQEIRDPDPEKEETKQDRSQHCVEARGPKSKADPAETGRSQGVVNLTARHSGGTVREFAIRFCMADGDTIPSFPLAIAAMADPRKAAAALARGKRHEFIDYPSREFDIIPIGDVADRLPELKDKVIIVGSLTDTSDLHATPLDIKLPGVLIHAYSISAILGSRYYTLPHFLFDWALAFLCCFLIIWLSLSMKSKTKGLLVRLIQIVSVYLAVQIGYWLFVDARFVYDFSYTMLMITFGMFAVDLWLGAVGLWELLSRRFRRTAAGQDGINHRIDVTDAMDSVDSGDLSDPPPA